VIEEMPLFSVGFGSRFGNLSRKVTPETLASVYGVTIADSMQRSNSGYGNSNLEISPIAYPALHPARNHHIERGVLPAHGAPIKV